MVTTSPETIAGHAAPASQLGDFRSRCEQLTGHDLGDPMAMHAFSVEEPALFWRALLDWTGLPWSGSADTVVTGTDVETARFFPDVALNYTESLLRPIDGADDDAPALTGVHADRPAETYSRRELRVAVARGATALARLGLAAGDRVVAIAPNTTGVAVAALSVAALGGTLSTATPDMGTAALLGRFEQVEPVLLLLDRTTMQDPTTATPALLAGLPTLRGSSCWTTGRCLRWGRSPCTGGPTSSPRRPARHRRSGPAFRSTTRSSSCSRPAPRARRRRWSTAPAARCSSTSRSTAFTGTSAPARRCTSTPPPPG
jgi:hypothetical protein